jgi:hypothetical protein
MWRTPYVARKSAPPPPSPCQGNGPSTTGLHGCLASSHSGIDKRNIYGDEFELVDISGARVIEWFREAYGASVSQRLFEQ